MDKRVFDDAIGEVPPSTVDVEAAIVRGRRADRFRRVASPAVAAGVAVVALTGVVAYTMTGDDQPGGSGVGVGTQPSTTSSSVPSSSVPPSSANGPAPSSDGRVTPGRGRPTPEPPEACSRPDLETAAELNARIEQVTRTSFQAQRPDLQIAPNPGMEYPDGVARGALEFFQVNSTPGTDQSICGPDNYTMARATTNGPEGAGNIIVVVQPAFYAASTLHCDGTSPEESSCEMVDAPNGDRIKKTTGQYEGGTSGTRVDIIRADGTSVMISAENIATTIKSGEGPTASAPPLNLDQLVAIGTAPGMTLFP
jgi:hypothetical protein